MKASIKIGRILGIPIYIHVTFLLILPLFAVYFATAIHQVMGFRLGYGGLGLDTLTELLFGMLAAIIFFTSVLVHELAHSYVALKHGYRISGITLFIFGGVAQIEEVPPRAPGEAVMAFAGPASSLAIGAVMMLFSRGIGTLGDTTGIILIETTFGLIGFYNVLLGLFNLLPAFPMDGGRILRAVLATRMDFVRATEVAASIGRAFAISMAIIGIFFNFWLVILAIFIYFSASGEERSTKLYEAFTGVKVKDIMTKHVSTIPPTMTVRELLDKMMEEKHMGYPVVEGDRVIGVVTLSDAMKVSQDRQGHVMVVNIMSRDIISVTPETEAIEVVKLLSTRGIGRVLVMESGRVVGIVTRTDLMKAMQILSARSGYRHVSRAG